jgi:hypothetical protein
MEWFKTKKPSHTTVPLTKPLAVTSFKFPSKKPVKKCLYYSTMQASELLGFRVYLLIILFTKASIAITFKKPNKNVTVAN